MNLLTWVRANLGNRIDFPGGAGGQCVDAANDYLTLVRGAAAVRANARDWAWPRTTIAGMRWTANTPTNYPPSGAVMVWQPVARAGISLYGHVAVVILADANIVLSADQDWSGVQALTLNLHGYRGAAGWWT